MLQLLTRDPKRRLGSGQDDAAPIKRHAFFKDISWDDLFHKRIPPPFYPSVVSAQDLRPSDQELTFYPQGSATDVSNFDSEFTNEKPYLTPVHSQLSMGDQREFEGFSWVCLSSLGSVR